MNNCELCGRIGRNVETEAKKIPRLRCYECYHAEYDRKFHSADRILSPEERDYAIAKKEYILKPQFYGEQPDYESFQKAADKFTEYELRNLREKKG